MRLSSSNKVLTRPPSKQYDVITCDTFHAILINVFVLLYKKTILKKHIRKEIGAFAQPDEVHFADGLPKTRSGEPISVVYVMLLFVFFSVSVFK